MNLTKLSCVTLVALGLAAGGCSKGSSSSEAPGASQGGEATPAESDKALTDGQIVQILSNVDQAEIQQAQVALTKSSNAQVRNYADMMINEHQTSTQQAKQLMSQNNISPTPSAPANKLQSKASQMLDKLNAAEPSDFDEMYIEGQSDQHKEVLEMINDKLIPSARDPMLQQQLTVTKSMVQHHIDAADKIDL